MTGGLPDLSTLPATARAAVSDGAGSSEVRQMRLGQAEGWLRVESSAICGTDVALHAGRLAHPAILGHHTIGVVAEASEALSRRLDVALGDRVAVEEYLGCQECDDCLRGDYRFCPRADLWGQGERVGMMPVTAGSGLLGGNAEFMELTPRMAVHRVPDEVPREVAAWTLPLANAIEWVVLRGGCTPGARVAVIGPGYHGLACAQAARTHGARHVAVLGRATDAERLGFAADLGAVTAVSEDLDPSALPSEFRDFDVVVDTVGSAQTTALAIRMLVRMGRLIVAGISADELRLPAGDVVRRQLITMGVRGRSPGAVRQSIELLSSGDHRLRSVPTAWIPLEGVGTVLTDLDRGMGPSTPHVVIDPWLRAAEVTSPFLASREEVS